LLNKAYEDNQNENEYSQCLGLCPTGWTTNGNKDKVCRQCDESCSACEDNGKTGDAARCTECAPTHKMLYAADSKCFTSCGLGYYQVYKDAATGYGNCDKCQLPCAECQGDKQNCTWCEWRVPFATPDDPKPPFKNNGYKTPALFVSK
tara:strand:+ start:19 stop:462 length:444 start_codon:yes stop_codon:yes gene_type:complete